ncbi:MULTISPECIES: superoxide dismutase family protein [unclassified Streptomyces]|uniref:superoxide dismutase family protein n=1 Tax=unclassified Streptomyces TaxID=2593676 RepID=UPI0033E63D74
MHLRQTLGAASAAAALTLSVAAQPAAADNVAVAVATGFAAATGSPAGRAVTYVPTWVPVGSLVAVGESADDTMSRFELSLRGVLPNHTYGAHVHRLPCGANPDDSGPHYQNQPDPVQPSTDPAYANPRNEVWLDLTTDARGDGKSTAQVPWRIRPGEANSLVIHEKATATGPGQAGTAGARLACVNVRFAPVSGAVTRPGPPAPLASLHD